MGDWSRGPTCHPTTPNLGLDAGEVIPRRGDGYWEGHIHPVYVTACNLTMLQLGRGYLPVYQR